MSADGLWISRRGRVAHSLLAGLGLLAAAGCAAIGRTVFREPAIAVRSLAVSNLSLTGGLLEVLLSVHNPNGYPLDALALAYRIDVDSLPVGAGTLDSRVVVPPKDSAIVRIPVRFSFLGLGAAGRSLLTTGTVRYRVRGDLRMATPVGTFTLPFDRPGRYALTSNR